MLIEHGEIHTQRLVDAWPHWWHMIDVGHGIFTPGAHDPRNKLETLGLPESLERKTVLDIGANDGFFSFECEERGAEVLATDWSHWNGKLELGRECKPRFKGFVTARQLRGSTVRSRIISCYNIQKLGVFDITLFLGVLYHVMHPTVALQRAVESATDVVFVETGLHDDNMHVAEPTMILTPDCYHGDPTNWWYPNVCCIEELMKLFGCKKVVRQELPPGRKRAVLVGYK